MEDDARVTLPHLVEGWAPIASQLEGSRVAAAEALTAAIGSADWLALSQTSDGATPVAMRPAAPTWSATDAANLLHALMATATQPTARFVSLDQVLPIPANPRTGAVNPGAAMSLLCRDFALEVDNPALGEPELDRIADDLAAVFGASVTTLVTVTTGTTLGRTPEPQFFDRVIVQLHGQRRAMLMSPSELSPHRWRGHREGPRESMGGVGLEVDTTMYIPRGWLVVPTPLDTLSISIEFRIHRLTVPELAADVVRRATDWPVLRADVPHDPWVDHGSYAGSVFDGSEAGAAALADLTSVRTIAPAIASRLAQVRTSTVHDALSVLHFLEDEQETWGRTHEVRLLAPGGLLPSLDSGALAKADAHHRFAAGGQEISVAAHAFEALTTLADRRWHPVPSVTLGCPYDEDRCRWHLMWTLMGAGVLEARSLQPR